MYPALMQLTASDYVLWGLATFLELILCVLVVRRGLHRRLPFFTGYLVLLIVCDALHWWIYHRWGYGSWAGWYFSRTAQGVMFAARGLVVVELCRVSLRAYRGIWALAWRLLCAIALLLLVSAAINAREHADHLASFVQAGERGLELAAAVVIDSVARLKAGVLGNENSAVTDSFGEDGLLDCPQYTRPAEFRGWRVPEVLLGGNHEEIRRWRRNAAREKTARVRPDLL